MFQRQGLLERLLQWQRGIRDLVTKEVGLGEGFEPQKRCLRRSFMAGES